jgi:hypothetical protein
MWRALRDRRLNGHKFVRQAHVGPYFVDFLCKEQKIIVEIDGGTHGTDREIAGDERRATALRRLGYRSSASRTSTSTKTSTAYSTRYSSSSKAMRLGDMRAFGCPHDSRRPLTPTLSPLASGSLWRQRLVWTARGQRGEGAPAPDKLTVAD